MMNQILDKTEKGREEIATRKYHLASRLRTLLLLADGKQRREDLLEKVAGLGLGEQSITELLENGFIQIILDPQIAGDVPTEPTPPDIQETPTLPAPDPPVAEGMLAEGETQLQALYRFYTETIKSTIGLRGYGLQLRIERANSIEDFRALRRPYLEAIFKIKGVEVTRSLRDRLDQLLYLGELTPPMTTIMVPKTIMPE